VPTFVAHVLSRGARPGRFKVSSGFGTHPNPAVAVEMALLEAAQTEVGNIAGSREDLTLKARSLGRHERTQPMSAGAIAARLAPQLPSIRFEDIPGFATDDALEELKWIVDRLEAAGVRRAVVVDCSRDELRPARVVRVLVPGLESNNPFFCGARARAVAIADLLPRCVRAS
jgi:ribosomal protein S12 methylthiotransferase accessory factor